MVLSSQSWRAWYCSQRRQKTLAPAFAGTTEYVRVLPHRGTNATYAQAQHCRGSSQSTRIPDPGYFQQTRRLAAIDSLAKPPVQELANIFGLFEARHVMPPSRSLPHPIE